MIGFAELSHLRILKHRSILSIVTNLADVRININKFGANQPKSLSFLDQADVVCTQPRQFFRSADAERKLSSSAEDFLGGLSKNCVTTEKILDGHDDIQPFCSCA